MKPREMRRQELYDLVWSKPITEIAKEIGVSDSMIIKVCRKLDVPRPVSGHWAKLRAGKPVSIRELPTKKPNTPELHLFYSTPTPQNAPVLKEPLHPLISREASPEFLIHVIDDENKMSSFSKKNLKSFMAGQLNDYSKAIPKLKEHYDLRVTKNLVPRAIFIVDSLLKAFEKRGWRFELSLRNEKYDGMKVTVLDEQFNFWIEESAKRVEHIPTKAELTKPNYWRDQWDYVSSGKLSLKIGSFSYSYASRGFNDGKKQRIENRLNQFCIALLELALERKESRRQREIELEAQKRREIRYSILKKAKESELKRREEFEAEFTQWLRAEKIREFVKIRESAFNIDSETEEAKLEFQGKQDWARNYADLIDPLAIGSPTIIEEICEDENAFSYMTRHY